MKKVLLISALIVLFSASASTNIHKVTRVIDGDTIVLDNGEKVRLLGVDAPELYHSKKKKGQCYAREAKDFTKWMVENRKVTLTFEGKRNDVYGRTLAWVWLDNGEKVLVNRELVRGGYAFSYRKYPTSRLEEFNRLEKQAQSAGSGLWAKDTCLNYYKGGKNVKAKD